MKYGVITGITAVICLLFIGAASADHAIDDSKNPGYLFVISASSGSHDGDKLTLKGVPSVLYFADRPERKAGHVSVEEFIESCQVTLSDSVVFLKISHIATYQ